MLKLLLPALLLTCLPQAAERHKVLEHPIELASAPEAFLKLSESLKLADPMRASFSEEKRIRALRKPLKSSGKLVVSKEHGLYRQQVEPRAVELLIQRTGISQRDAVGTVERFDATQQPIVRAFIDAFLLVLSGDRVALDGQFRLHFEGTMEQWALGLVPRKEPLAKVIESIVVEGRSDKVERYTIREVSGDSTSVTWTEVTTKSPLTDDETKRWFSWGT